MEKGSIDHDVSYFSIASRVLMTNYAMTTPSLLAAGFSLAPEYNASHLETIVTHWLEKLLQHFGIHQIEETSEQELISWLANRAGDDIFPIPPAVLQDSAFLSHLKRRIVRLAGVRLDTAFVAIAANAIDEADTEAVSLSVESSWLRGVRYQGQVYRLVEKFAHCHRLQAFCLGQTFREQMIGYLITFSSEHFAVWVEAQTLPHR